MKYILSLVINYFYYYLWIIKGKPCPPANILYKRIRISKMAKKYNCSTFVETGTANGKTVMFLRKRFELLFSVEIYKPCYENAIKNTAHIKNIKLYLGDSKSLLRKMIGEIRDRALFWLDGHYSGIGTGRGESDCPVLNELESIKNAERNDHLILIDDAREFNGQNDYPTVELVYKKLKEINPDYKINIKYDCIIAIPANLYNESDKNNI